MAKTEETAGLSQTLNNDFISSTNGGKSLVIRQKTLSEESFQRISALESLDTLILIQDKFNEKHLAYLSSLIHLKTLVLTGSSFSDVGIRVLPDLPELTSLSLPGTNITDVGLTELCRFTKLGSINVSQTHITTLNGLICLHNLEKLDIANCRALNTLEPLVTLPKLESLNISRTRSALTNEVGRLRYLKELSISELNLSELRKLKAHLRQVNFSGCFPTKRSLNQFKKSLPNTRPSFGYIEASNWNYSGEN
ncbi:MAG: hypothetical protein K2X81_10980 [Candidatus Obscuribacterales bacterium]|nr:hypothetical protein [Candidatus Obscuribacterales bacterium]